MLKTTLRKLLVGVSVGLVTFVLLEVLVRISGYSQRHVYDPIYMSFDLTGDIPYVHKPNLTQVRGRGLAVINTDSMGLRSKTSGAVYGPKRLHEFRIAIVGDSVTFGEGVRKTEDTFSQVLEDTLNQQQHDVTVRVFNYGASAYSVKEMVATLQYRMLDIQPDLVVMALIPSDFDLSRTPIIDNEGYLIDQRLSRFSPPGSMTRRALRHIHLTYVLRDIGLRWIFTPQNIDQVLSRGEMPETYSYVRQFKETAEQHGISYGIVLLPRMRNNAWAPIRDQLLRDRVTHIDMSCLENEFTEGQYMASRFDPHASPAVHHRIGETLADYMQDNSFLRRRSHGPDDTGPITTSVLCRAG